MSTVTGVTVDMTEVVMAMFGLPITPIRIDVEFATEDYLILSPPAKYFVQDILDHAIFSRMPLSLRTSNYKACPILVMTDLVMTDLWTQPKGRKEWVMFRMPLLEPGFLGKAHQWLAERVVDPVKVLMDCVPDVLDFLAQRSLR